MALLDNSTAKRLGILCFYDKNGRAARFLDGFLADLMQNLTDLVVIVNGKIDDEARKMFGKYTDTIMVRENKGLDVAAYKQALLTIGWEKLETYDEVLCLNDTIMGPALPVQGDVRNHVPRGCGFLGHHGLCGRNRERREDSHAFASLLARIFDVIWFPPKLPRILGEYAIME